MKKLIEQLIIYLVITWFPFVTRSIVRTIIDELVARSNASSPAPFPPSATCGLPSNHLGRTACL